MRFQMTVLSCQTAGSVVVSCGDTVQYASAVGAIKLPCLTP